MVSAASGGSADRIAARIFFTALRAGSGVAAMYSSTVSGFFPLGEGLLLEDLRTLDFVFFIGTCYENFRIRSMFWRVAPDAPYELIRLVK